MISFSFDVQFCSFSWTPVTVLASKRDYFQMRDYFQNGTPVTLGPGLRSRL